MQRLDGNGIFKFVGSTLMVLLCFLTTGSVAYAQEPYQRMVRRFELPELGISNPAGLAYSPGARALLVATSAGPASLTPVTFAPDISDEITITAPVADPLNMVFDGRSNSLLFFDAGADELVEIQAGSDGRLQSGLTRFDARAFSLAGARGLTVDPATGDLFALVVFAKPAVPRIVRIIPNSQDRFAGPVVSSVVLNALRNEDLQGIAFNPSNDHLYVLATSSQRLYELSLEGMVLSTRDLSEFELRGTRSMVFAPSGDQTDDPEIMNLYIAESGAYTPDAGQTVLMVAGGTGDIVEVSVTEPEVLDLSSITVQASLVRTIHTSQWSPPSPDPAGAAYFPPSNNLLISDSEVNEMSIFEGVNFWEASLSGNPVQELSTTSFSDEPTGVAYNPDNGHLFFSDDTGTRSVYELDPGPDGRYDTSDDVVTSFRTGDFSSDDPEGIAYDTFQGHLFMADGVNAEIYEIDPGPNGVFDGISGGGDDIVDHFDTSRMGLPDPEGVEFNPDTGNLHIISRKEDIVVETTRDGTVVNVLDVSFANAKNLGGLAYGPSSGNASQKSLYLVDRGTDNDSDPNENDGKIYEVSLGTSTPTPALATDDVTVQEGDAGTVEAIFTVTLSSVASELVTVNYSTEDGSATTAGNDYDATSGQLSFQSGETEMHITVPVNGDLDEESDENFFVNLSNATNATIGDGQGEATIINDDQAPSIPSISIDDISAVEGAGTVAFTVSLSAAGSQDVHVDYTLNDGTAVAPDDYGPASGTLIIPAGSNSGPINVTLNDDESDEGDETFTVDLSNPVNATIDDAQGVGTIVDNDDSGGGQTVTVSFQDGLNGYSGTRDTKLIADSPGSNFATLLELETDGAPDKSALLYWDVTSIPIGSSVQSVDVTLNVTNTSSDNYEFYKVLRTWEEGEATWNEYASGQSWQIAGANGTQDRDPTVLGAIAGSSTGPAAISLNAAGIAAVQTWINDPSSNHGIAVLDYVDAGNGLDFSSRETGTASDRPMLTVTYGSDGSAPASISIADVTVTEGNSGTIDATFAVTLSPASTEIVTVEYTTADGTASAGSDYASISGQLTLQPGETAGSITVVVNGDEEIEQNETFFVDLSNQVNAVLADNQGEGTITNDDTGGGGETVTISFQDGINGYDGTRDTELNADSPGTNYGSAAGLELDGRPDRSSLISWDLTAIPQESIVQSVDLIFNVTNSSSQTYELYESLQPWVEGEATWNEYASGQSWEVAGADGASDRGSTVLGAITGGKGLAIVSLNVAGISVVQSWVDDPASNRGFILLDYVSASNGLDFSSRENGASANNPKLTVTYASPSQSNSTLALSSEAVVHLPETLTLNPNYPNPFNLETRIEYALPNSAQVRLVIYNITGQEVRTLVDEMQPAGYQSVVWDGRDDAGRMVGSGIYLNRLSVSGQSLVRKIVLQK